MLSVFHPTVETVGFPGLHFVNLKIQNNRDGRILRLAIIERGQDVVGGINVLNGKKRVFLLKFPGSHANGIALLLEFGEILFGFHFR